MSLENGPFSFKFVNAKEKRRVMEEGPWCFARDLLVLKQCKPDIPKHCYEFTHSTFWVQLIGIPRGGVTEDVLFNVAAKIGEVLEVKVESRGSNLRKVAKAKVLMDPSTPLKSGTILTLRNKKLWVDFCYERLPKFCY